jgi:hypothetical protein
MVGEDLAMVRLVAELLSVVQQVELSLLPRAGVALSGQLGSVL